MIQWEIVLFSNGCCWVGNTKLSLTEPSLKNNHLSSTSGSKTTQLLTLKKTHKQKCLMKRMQMKWICCQEKWKWHWRHARYMTIWPLVSLICFIFPDTKSLSGLKCCCYHWDSGKVKWRLFTWFQHEWGEWNLLL